MRPDQNNPAEFIRGHCGSVTIEAPSDRATGAQRYCLNQWPPVQLHRKIIDHLFTHSAGQAFPSGLCLLRVCNP